MSKELEARWAGLPRYWSPSDKDLRPMSWHPNCFQYPFHHLILNMWSINELNEGKGHCVWCGMKTYWIDLERSDENEMII